ncbi:carboxypeptidase-like regulatory domain-containing protein [Hymenobacter tenuis]
MRFLSWGLVPVLLLPLLSATPQQAPITVLDATTKGPVPYASVGIQHKSIGTIADALGHFSAEVLAAAAPTDTLVVSCVGYQPRKLLAGQLSQFPDIQLTPLATQLAEVAIRHGKLHPKVLGREATGGMAYLSTGAVKDSVSRNKRGREVGTFLTPSDNCFVDEFALYVAHNTFRFVRFRLMLYDVKDGRPTTLLSNQDMQFVVGDQVTGWVNVDLRPFNLHLKKHQKIALALQWLDNDEPMGPGKYLSIPAAFPAPLHRTYTRDKSEATWQSFPVNPSMQLRVQAYTD